MKPADLKSAAGFIAAGGGGNVLETCLMVSMETTSVRPAMMISHHHRRTIMRSKSHTDRDKASPALQRFRLAFEARARRLNEATQQVAKLFGIPPQTPWPYCGKPHTTPPSTPCKTFARGVR